MLKKKKIRAKQDNAWKDILDVYLQESIAYFFPEVVTQIDWSVGYETLDSELQAITTDAMIGKTYVDKLVKVTSLDGKEGVILIHLEIQARKEENFAERLFHYYAKLFSKYNQSILTLVILTDGNKSWRPHQYQKEVLGFSVLSFNFLTCKLIDYRDKRKALEKSDNPFAMVALAHLAFLETKKDVEARYTTKVDLMRRLYKKGRSRDYIVNVFKMIDWVLALPEVFALKFKEKLHELEEENNMSYITSIERLSREEGREEGRHEGRHEEAINIARNMLGMGANRDFIKKATRLTDQDLLLILED